MVIKNYLAPVGVRLGLGLAILLSIVISLFAAEIVVSNLKVKKSNSVQNQIIDDYLGGTTEIETEFRKAGITSQTYNIYYFGESTMEGAPYYDTIPRLVDQALQNRVSGQELKWLNFAKSGADFSQTVEKINFLIENQQLYQPSLVVIYAGHNQFLKYHSDVGFYVSKSYPDFMNFLLKKSQLVELLAENFKIYNLEIDDRKYFDAPLFPIEKYDQEATEYNQQLSLITSKLKQHNIPVIVSTQIANYADFEPNRSVYCQDETSKTRFTDLMTNAAQIESQGQIEAATALYLEALNLCAEFAETHYLLGKTYQKLGQFELAWNQFKQAVDLDRMPLRAFSSQNNHILTLADDKLVQVIDSEALLRAKSETGLIGYNFMVDGHHPNVAGYLEISNLLAKTIQNLDPETILYQPVKLVEAQKLLIPTPNVNNDILIDRAEWLIRISTWRFDSAQRLKRADEYLDLVSGDKIQQARKYLNKMTIMSLKKDSASAQDFYLKAKTYDLATSENYINNNPWIKKILVRSQE